jgi:thiamine transporter ThiT
MWRLASSHRARVLLLAGALFVGVFVLRMVGDAAGTGVGFLYVLPIVMLAVEFGRRAGLTAGVVALALFAVWG